MNKRAAAAMAVVLLLEEEEEEQKGKRRTIVREQWVSPFLQTRQEKGFFMDLEGMLRAGDPKLYKNFVRMSAEDFDVLLAMVGPRITKKDTPFRQAIKPAERLAITLRFLATGDSYATLMFLFRVSRAAISQIIRETCQVLFEELKSQYLKFPDQTEWKEIATKFEKIWNYPFCCGALDGKHIQIKAPADSGSLYFNYKKTNSIVLMALADAEYKFSYVDVGAYGRESDGGGLARSSLAKRLCEGALPPPEPLGAAMEQVPYCIVADDAFPIKPYIMKPFPMRDLTMPQRIFNYRLSRSRRIIENVFGICAARFRVLLKPMELKPEKVNKVVLAICALHNFLITRKSLYATSADFDRENEYGTVTQGNWRAEVPEESLLPLEPLQHQGRIPEDARTVRTRFMNYFMAEGDTEQWAQEIFKTKKNYRIYARF